VFGLDGVAQVGVFLGPGYIEGDAREEIVDYCDG
jgi:hypothetical protein